MSFFLSFLYSLFVVVFSLLSFRYAVCYIITTERRDIKFFYDRSGFIAAEIYETIELYFVF